MAEWVHCRRFFQYGGGKINDADGSMEELPVREKDQLYVLLRDAIIQCDQWCKERGIDLHKIETSNILFSKLSLFDEFTEIILSSEEDKKQFIVYDNTIDALYEASKPEILGRRKEFPLAVIIHYLRSVMDGRAGRGNIDSAKRRISQLLDESIIAQDEPINTAVDNVLEDSPYYIKAWKQIDLSKLNIEKLREEYQQAPYKHIEIADLRSIVS